MQLEMGQNHAGYWSDWAGRSQPPPALAHAHFSAR
jgi:hypothetical protein